MDAVVFGNVTLDTLCYPVDDVPRHQSITFDRAIVVQVSRLRRKIETDPANPIFIKTVRGGGYIFTPAVERQ